MGVEEVHIQPRLALAVWAEDIRSERGLQTDRLDVV